MFHFFYFLLRVTVRHARHSTNSRTLNVHSKKIMSQAKNERFSDSCKIDKLVYTTKTSHTCCNQCIHYLIFHKKNWYLEIMPKLLCQIINFQKNREIFLSFHRNEEVISPGNESSLRFHNWLILEFELFEPYTKFEKKKLT